MRMNNEAVAELIGATRRHGAVQALAGVDLRIARGEVYALLGPNGAGKTTAISLLLGLLRPDSGEARLFGQPPQQLAARRRIGVMLQSAELPENLSVRELILQTCRYYPQPRGLDEVAALAGLDSVLQRRYGKLSGGQQRRVQFALAVCGRPELLFLDEPTVGMDSGAREQFWKTIRALVGEGCAVVLTTHYLEEAEVLADRVGVLAQGRLLAEDSTQAIRGRVGQRQIRCLSTLDAQQVLTWPQVHSAWREQDRLRIVTPAAEDVLRRLLAADAGVQELEVQRAGLAEALQTITGEAA
jgi:ABC-2 type transport system ATP-binding protein